MRIRLLFSIVSFGVLSGVLLAPPAGVQLMSLPADYPYRQVMRVLADGRLFAVEGTTIDLLDAEGRTLAEYHLPEFANVGLPWNKAEVASDGALYVPHERHLDRYLPGGGRDPSFASVAAAIDGEVLLNGSAITNVVADEVGGCWFAGYFDEAGNLVGAADPLDWTLRDSVVAWGMAHADRFGRVTAIVREPSLLNPNGILGGQLLFRNGDEFISVSYNSIRRIGLDGVVRPFSPDLDISSAYGGPWITGASYDPRYGLAVVAEGDGFGLTAPSGRGGMFALVLNLDGTIKSSFRPMHFFGTVYDVVWDNVGRLLVGGIQDGGVDDPDHIEGVLRGGTYGGIIMLPTPDGFTEIPGRPSHDGGPAYPRFLKRFLPDGSVDPAWSRALCYEYPMEATVFNILPDGIITTSVPIFGVTGIINPEPTPGHQHQQSVRGRIARGDLPLIMGLIIEGDTANDLLIRAVGPSLAQFGVQDAAHGTQFSVYRGSEHLITVGPGSYSRPVAWATEKVGAFPLDESVRRREAQTLLQLPPGVYTIQIEVPAPFPDGQVFEGGTVLGEIYFL